MVVVDEAYLEYTSDFDTRSAASLVREGVDVVVFRTFDKIYGLAGMPIGYVLAPVPLADSLRKEGAGDAEGLGRLNLGGGVRRTCRHSPGSVIREADRQGTSCFGSPCYAN